MPILQSFADPRLQVFLDFIGQAQIARKQEEEERERSRARKKKRAIIGGSLAAGAVGGFLAPGFLGGAAGGLTETLIGAGVGAGVGGAITRDDPAGAAQALIQGIGTIGAIPDLQQQGISPMQILAAGPQGLQSLMRQGMAGQQRSAQQELLQGQIGRRQQENLVRQEAMRSRLKDERLQALPPFARAEYATAGQYITENNLAAQRGELDEDALQQANAPHLALQQATLEANPPQQPPTITEQVKQDSDTDPVTGNVFYRSNGALKFSRGNVKPESAADLQSTIDSTTLLFREEKKNNHIAIAQQVMIASGMSPKKARVEAENNYKDNMVLQDRIARDARERAEKQIMSLTQRTRQAQGQLTSDERQEAQENAEQQQVQQQQAQQQQEQAEQAQRAQALFENSAESLRAIRDSLGSDLSKWSKADLETAASMAAGLAGSAPLVLPSATLEQKQAILPLLRFAEDILEAYNKSLQ